MQRSPPPTSHPLDGCHAKLARADELLANLKEEIAQWHERGDGQVVGEYRPSRREYVYVVRLVPPPLRWGAILGDWAHNLRSSLDTLLWQLVLLRGGEPTRRTQFPIFLRRAQYRARAPAMIAGVARTDRGTLERLQPFHGSRGRIPASAHPLARLAWLSNVDKHRLVHPATTGFGIGSDFDDSIGLVGVPNVDAGSIVRTIWTPDTWFRDGSEVVRFQLSPCGPEPVVRLSQPIGVAIAFGARHFESFAFNRIRRGVGRVFEAFEPAFEQEPKAPSEPEDPAAV